MTSTDPVPVTPGQGEACPIAVVLADGMHSCTLHRNHDGGHDFADEPDGDSQGDPHARIAELEDHITSLAEDLDDAAQTIEGYREAFTVMQRERGADGVALKAADAHNGTLRAQLATGQRERDYLRERFLWYENDRDKWREAAGKVTAERDEARARIAELEALLADAVNPTAQDYDNAAEILRLRDLVAEILSTLGPPGSSQGRKQVAEWRQRAGLEPPASTEGGRRCVLPHPGRLRHA